MRKLKTCTFCAGETSFVVPEAQRAGGLVLGRLFETLQEPNGSGPWRELRERAAPGAKMAEALDVSLEQFRKDRVVAVFDDDFVMDAQEVARKNGIHHLVVMHGKGLVGVVCTCDMLHVPPDTKVGSLMHTPATLPVSAGTLKAASLMDTAHVGSVLLLDQGLPCGIVTRGEIFRVDPKTAQAAGLSRCNCCGGTSHIQQFSEQGALCVYCAARFGKSLS